MKIERIEVLVVELPLRLQRTFSSGSWDTGPAGQLLGKPVFVKIHAEGVTGVAQIRPISPGHFLADTVHSVTSAITDILGPLLIGRRLADIEANDQLLSSRLHGNPAARAVLDIAMYDALGKAHGVSICDLIGGRSQGVLPLEWSVSLYDDVGKIIADARRAVDEFGIKVLCLKAAGPKGWREDVRNFQAVRKALGEDVVIGIDPNTGWSVADTIRALDALHDYDVGYMEQPIDRRNLAGLAEIRGQARGVPLMADESLFTIEDAAHLAKAQAADVFCIKLYKVGGLTPAKKIAAIAQANDIGLNCGGLAAASQFEAAASAQFCATIPASRTFGAAEFAFGAGVMGPDPLVAAGGMTIENGSVRVPTGPGLGLVLDEDALKRMTLKSETVKA